VVSMEGSSFISIKPFLLSVPANGTVQ
jgi:hypothetical protein